MNLMRNVLLAMCCVLLTGNSASAQESPEPLITVAIRSVNDLRRDVLGVVKPIDELAKASGEETLEEILTEHLGAKNEKLAGVHLDRPAGIYFVPNDAGTSLVPVFVLPIKDRNAFAAADYKVPLFKIGKVARDEVHLVPITTHYAHDHVYISADASAVNDRPLPHPDGILSEGRHADLTVMVSAGGFKQKIGDSVKANITSSLSNVPAAMQMLPVVNTIVEELVNGTQVVGFRLNMDSQTRDVKGELQLVPGQDSRLAEVVGKFGPRPSRFAALVGKRSWCTFLWSLPIEPILKQVPPAIAPTLKEYLGDEALDFIIDMNVTEDGKEVGTLLAVSLKDSAAAEASILATAADAPFPTNVNAHSIGEVKVHAAQFKSAFQSNNPIFVRMRSHPILYAFHNNAWYMAFGRDALKTLQRVIPIEHSTVSNAPFRMDLSLKQLVAVGQDQRLTDPASDKKLNLTIVGGKRLKVDLTFNADSIAEIIRLGRQARKAQSGLPVP